MDSRVILIYGEGIRIFEWHGKRLFSSFSFENSSEGKNTLDAYLSSIVSLPSFVLLDVLDEEFQHEKIPHLRGRNRQAVINRQVKRHCREAKFTFSKIVGRDSSGRRDDDLLITSITESSDLENWLGVFEEHSQPIIGIWSLPILSQDLLSQINKGSSNLLLVSRQADDVLRETMFKDKQIYLSRHITSEDNSEEKAESYISNNLDQIHKFLANQRIIPFNHKLDIYCLMPEALLSKAKIEFPSTATLEYKFCSLEKLFVKMRLKIKEAPSAEILFSYLCTKRWVASEHYRSTSTNNMFYRYCFNKLFYFGATFGSALLIFLAASIYVSSLSISKESQTVKNSISEIEELYDKRFRPREELLSKANLIQESVKFHAVIQRESNVSPERFFPPLASVYSQEKFSVINLEGFLWEKMHGSDLDKLRRSIWRATTPNLTQYSEYEYVESEMDDQIPVVTISGRFIGANDNYSETVTIMESFVSELSRLEQVVDVQVLQTPVDIRVTSRFSDVSGADTKLLSESKDKERYEIILLLKETQPNLSMQVAGDG